MPDASGDLALWSEVAEKDKRRFGSIVFSRGTICERDGQRLRDFYNVMNYGGVAHEPHERALPDEAEQERPTA